MLGQNRGASRELETTVVLILQATRLPRLTLVIALEYINQRFAGSSALPLEELQIFIYLVVALILANKFNDDNTFTNRSWSGASGLAIDVLNSEESAWLAAVEWKLNTVKFQSNIATLEECWKTWCVKWQHQGTQPVLHQSYACADYPPIGGHASAYPSPPLSDSTRSFPSSPLDGLAYSLDWNAAPGLAYYGGAQPSIWAYDPYNSYPSYPYVGPYVNDNAAYGYGYPYYCSLATC